MGPEITPFNRNPASASKNSHRADSSPKISPRNSSLNPTWENPGQTAQSETDVEKKKKPPTGPEERRSGAKDRLRLVAIPTSDGAARIILRQNPSSAKDPNPG